MYYIIRVVDESVVREFDTLEDLLEEYKPGDIVAKKISVIPVPEK